MSARSNEASTAEAAAPAAPRRRRLPSDLGPRVAVAVPAAAVLLALIHVGGAALAIPLAVLAALGHVELVRLARLAVARRGPAPRAGAGPAATARSGLGERPDRAASDWWAAAPGAVAAAAVTLTALGGGAAMAATLAGAAALAALAAAAAAPRGRRRRAARVPAAGVVWLGGCLGHAVLLRELPHGAALVVAVLLATFLGDTAAQLVGTAIGRRRIAPSISPNKTLEGLLAGIAGGTLAAAGFLLAFHGWATPGGALALAGACVLAAPAGDLLESAVKRRAGVKDSGTLFGAHGGVLDRADAAILACLVGYHVARAVF